jgi:hypothetical protein
MPLSAHAFAALATKFTESYVYAARPESCLPASSGGDGVLDSGDQPVPRHLAVVAALCGGGEDFAQTPGRHAEPGGDLGTQ